MKLNVNYLEEFKNILTKCTIKDLLLIYQSTANEIINRYIVIEEDKEKI